jgi:tRNA (guanosine-2'-O-)-methyltransferase
MVRSPRRLEKISRVLAHRQAGLTVVLENIHDPHNVSAILRTCDAVGVMGVELLYTTEKFPRIGKKSSSSASKWVEHRRHRSVGECFAFLRGEGMRILATRLEPRARTLYDLDLTQRTAFVFGNEHRGVSDEAAEQADECILVPMLGMIESLNVSVAAGVCLYETLRQRLAAGMLERSQLPPEILSALESAWRKK